MSKPRYFYVTLTIRDAGDDDFWRKHRGVEPDVRLAGYVRDLIGAGEKITKYRCLDVAVEPAGEPNSHPAPDK